MTSRKPTKPRTKAAAEPAPAATNVISLSPRLKPLPTPEAIERTLLAEEFADEFKRSEDYDPSRLEHRALSINGALSKFDHVPLTGREYWQVYGKSPDKETFIVWVMAAKKTIDDIVKEYKNV